MKVVEVEVFIGRAVSRCLALSHALETSIIMRLVIIVLTIQTTRIHIMVQLLHLGVMVTISAVVKDMVV